MIKTNKAILEASQFMGIKYHFLFFMLLSFFYVNQSFSQDNRLLFFTDKNCPYCQWWEKDIGEIYPKTDFAEEFKLTRISFKTDLREITSGLKKSVLGTPTFVFIHLGREIGRIEGYNGPEMFWWQVESIIYDKIDD